MNHITITFALAEQKFVKLENCTAVINGGISTDEQITVELWFFRVTSMGSVPWIGPPMAPFVFHTFQLRDCSCITNHPKT